MKGYFHSGMFCLSKYGFIVNPFWLIDQRQYYLKKNYWKNTIREVINAWGSKPNHNYIRITATSRRVSIYFVCMTHFRWNIRAIAWPLHTAFPLKVVRLVEIGGRLLGWIYATSQRPISSFSRLYSYQYSLIPDNHKIFLSCRIKIYNNIHHYYIIYIQLNILMFPWPSL